MGDTVKLYSNQVVLLSEDNDDNDSIDAKFIICDFSPNANDVSLNRSTIEDWLDTLLNKPVVGKVVKKFDGKEDFTGHNVKVVEEVDSNGNKYKTVEFDTQAFGSFYNVGLETIDGVENIVATAKIWKRFKTAFRVFKERAESKKGLKTSWEISVKESHTEKIKNKKIKVIDDGIFIGHAVLGADVQPAYKSSGVINVSSEEEHDMELAEALSQDVLSLSEDENISDDKDSIKNQAIANLNKGGNEFVGSNKNPDTSALTENDVYRKVRKAINSTSEDKYYYLSMIYPYEYKAYAYTWDREKDSDFIEFTYVVNSDDTISITSQKAVEMTFVLKETIDSQVAQLQKQLEDAEKQIAEAGKSLTDLSKEKEQLEATIAELTPFKEKVEEMIQAEKEKELAEKKEQLKSHALEDDLITSEELEQDEQLASIFAELTLENFEASQEKIDVIKGRKAIAKFKSVKNNNQDMSNVDTSSTNKFASTKTDLNNGDSDAILSAVDIIKSVLNKNK
ncbi:hypothetical protein EDM57_05155 [Brevibacillus gelatini]|uniref:Uncharacterized protein n=1 Tax=Brevibacillus gelatini TaxID=1655277 RepID=A0A3M8B7V3_9BACL|nr:hypothetical protein [Brevibacillus gelatini]RNB59531.1 hypothetical protein EDM57_05155 [Brevibacillus gelatini]